ncbi:hypothetical protein [Schleiferilactobacillus shenzhenensis]|uniref:Uncharacterized protein n=1 Tax=Schleiferilactobacillus shenzhenensis LY-73 TaxID=1231336 RepID=U4TUA9_9LACO|nr:hypothetical protein [Schleiferilactobacillus shenzhenensis]ERL65027.1 hypothetical protein L248_2965 [Schleiferilactobacillus shenzhenensis LY-73]
MEVETLVVVFIAITMIWIVGQMILYFISAIPVLRRKQLITIIGTAYFVFAVVVIVLTLLHPFAYPLQLTIYTVSGLALATVISTFSWVRILSRQLGK